MEFYRRELPDTCVSLCSQEGKDIFRESFDQGYVECYFPLAAQFRTQDDPAFCGLATLVMALNALEIDPKRVWKGPWRWYHEEMLDCCIPIDAIRKNGITFDEFICLAECNGLSCVNVCHVDDNASEDFFRKLVMETTSSEGRVVITSYSRKVLKQTGDGHFTTIGGYNSFRDLVLILDTARFKYPPHWVSLNLLWESMKATDKVTGNPRGYMVVEKTSNQGLSVFRPNDCLNGALISSDSDSHNETAHEIFTAWNLWIAWLQEPSHLSATESNKLLELALDNMLCGLSFSDSFFIRPKAPCRDLEAFSIKAISVLRQCPIAESVIELLEKNEKWEKMLSSKSCCQDKYLETMQAAVIAFLLSFPYSDVEGTNGDILGRLSQKAKVGMDETVLGEIQLLTEIFSNLIGFKLRCQQHVDT